MNFVSDWFQRKLRRGEIGVGWAKTTFYFPGALLFVLAVSRIIVGGMFWNFPWPECRQIVLNVTWTTDLFLVLCCFPLGLHGMRRKGVFGDSRSLDEIWLATTPFAEKYIFKGPLYPLLAVDLSLIGIVTVVIQATGAAPAGLAIVAYLAGLLSNSCRILLQSDERWSWYASALCLSILPSAILGLEWLPNAVVLGLCNALISSSLRRAFCEGEISSWANIGVTPRKEIEIWPYCELHESGRQFKKMPQPLYGWMMAVLGATSAFSVVFVSERLVRADSLNHPGENQVSSVLLPWIVWNVAAMVLALLRMLVFIYNHHSPLSILGRISQRKWLVPQYDIALATPLAMVAVTILTTLSSYVVPSLLALPVGVFVLLMLFCYGPPDWKTWRLTAPVRIGEPPEPINTEPAYQRL